MKHIFWILALLNFPSLADEVIQPRLEGTYVIDVSCKLVECKKFQGATRLTLLDTKGDKGWVIGIRHPEYSFAQYLFTVTYVEKGGRLLRADSAKGGGKFAELEIELDPATLAITGWIRDPAIPKDIRITGRQRFSPTSIVQHLSADQIPALYELQGNYEVKIGERKRTLALRHSLSDQKLLAKYTRVDGTWNVMAVVDYDRETGILHLIGAPPDDVHEKWILACHFKGDDVRCEGLGFSAWNGKVNEVRF